MRTARNLSLMAGCLSVLLLFMVSCATAVAPAPTPKPTAAPSKETPNAKPPGAPLAASSTPKPSAEQSRYGGLVTRVMNRDVPSFDLQRELAGDASQTLFNVYQGLVRLHPTEHQKIMPDLAEQWEISPDGKIYTFALHKGVTWHDGKPFTSADVKFSLERIAEYDGLGFMTEAIDKIDNPDENTLKVFLKRRQPAFLPLIGHGRGLVGPKHVVEAKKDLRRDAIGTGPFSLKEYISGVSFRMEKNKKYFLKERPYLDGLTYYIVKDAATRFAGFRTGRFDIYGHPPAYTELGRTQAETIKREMSQAVLRPYESAVGYGLMLNWNRAPWDDVKVRRAAFLAVDRERGLEVVSEGVGTVGVTMIYGEWALPKEELAKMPGFRKPKDEDMAEAKRLMAEAGHSQGFKSSVTVRAAEPLYEKAATYMADQLSKIGIELAIKITEYGVFVDARNKLNFDTMLMVMGLSLDDPDGASRFLAKKLGGNFASSDDEKILELFEKQSRAESTEERKKIVFDLQRRVVEVVPHILMGWQNSFIAFSPKVKNYTADGSIFSHNKLEEIWLAK